MAKKLTWSDLPADVVSYARERGMIRGLLDLDQPCPTHGPDGRKLTARQVAAYYTRQTAAWTALYNERDPGRGGRAEEYCSAPVTSLKTRISTQGKTDVWVSIRRNGKPVRCSVEVKTGGGNIDAVLTSAKTGQYVVYGNTSSCPAGARGWNNGNDRFHLAPRIVPRAVFLAILERGGQRNNKRYQNGSIGYAVQPTNKFLNLFLAHYAPRYDPMREYSDEDFAGLLELVTTHPGWDRGQGQMTED